MDLSYNDAGLVHWLVSDVACHLAVLYGLRDDAELLYEAACPAGRRSPGGVRPAVKRVHDAAREAAVEVTAELRDAGIGGSARLRRDSRVPGDLDAAASRAARSELWVGATTVSRAALVSTLRHQVHLDHLDAVRLGCETGEGRVSHLLWSLRLRLRCHAREISRWPLEEGEAELIVGGSSTYWPDEVWI